MENLCIGMKIPHYWRYKKSPGKRYCLQAMLLLMLLFAFIDPANGQTVVLNPLPDLAGGTLAIADYDSDGDQDVYLTGIDTLGVLQGGLFRHTTSGFTLLSTGLPVVVEGAAAWADYDADGDPDIALAGNISGQRTPITQIWRNDGGGTFTQLALTMTPLGGAALAWADLDNDGDPDLAGAGEAPGSIGDGRIWRNDGGGNFTQLVAPWAGYARSIAIADFDGDSYPDVAAVNASINPSQNFLVRIWRNTGSLQFVPFTLPQQLCGEGQAVWADMDGTGTPDLLVSAWGEQNSTAIVLNTAGVFTEAPISLPQSAFSAIAVSDYDSDGDYDIALAGTDVSGTPYTHIYENVGTGLNLNASVLTGVMLPILQFKDMDGNGQPDLIVSGGSVTAPSTIIYYNTAGTFQP